jgi:hypothetical protein
VSFLLTGFDSAAAVHSALVWLLVQTLSVSFLMTGSDSAVAVHSALIWLLVRTSSVLFLVHLYLPGIGAQGLECKVPFF